MARSLKFSAIWFYRKILCFFYNNEDSQQNSLYTRQYSPVHVPFNYANSQVQPCEDHLYTDPNYNRL